MVKVFYKGANTLGIAGYKLVAGSNEIKDDDFYKMMRIKTFAGRIKEGILEVEKGFPLEKTEAVKNEVKEKISLKDLEEEIKSNSEEVEEIKTKTSKK